MQKTITAASGREASLRKEIEQLTERLEEANTRLAQRVQMIKHEVISSHPSIATSSPPPPPLPKGRLHKRAREVYVDSKQLVMDFTGFLEDAKNRDRALSVKNSLRLDMTTLTKNLEKALCVSLSSHVGKWLKEEKRPDRVDSADWEDAVDESLNDHRNEALDRYKFPNANRLVVKVLLHLRQHYRPKTVEAQGNIIAELQSGAKRLKRIPTRGT